MKKRLITAMAALLVLSGCGSTVEQKEEFERPTVENAKEKFTTYFEERGFEVVAETDVADYFAYVLTVNSWDLPGGKMTVYLSADDEDPALLRTFSVNVVRYATLETFKSTDVLCERFKIDEIYCDIMKLFVPSYKDTLTTDVPKSMMQHIIDDIDPSSSRQKYIGSYLKECPVTSWFWYSELTPNKTEWILGFDTWFDGSQGCSVDQEG